MSGRLLPLPVALLLLQACDGKAVVETENQPPGAPTVSIGPLNPDTSADLVVVVDVQSSDRDGDAVSYRYSWKQDGLPREDLMSDTVPAAETTKGEVWEVSVTPNDGEDDGTPGMATATILNALPTVAVTITPDAPVTGDDLQAVAMSEDADGDAVTLRYAWSLDGAPLDVAADTVRADQTSHGQRWMVTVTPSDGDGEGAPGTAEVEVANSAPEVLVVTLEPAAPYVTDDVVAVVDGYDADADAITYRYTFYVDGTEVQSGESDTLAAGLAAKHQILSVEVVPNDGFEDGAAFDSADAVVADSLPTATSASIDPSTVYEASTLTCVPAGFADADGDPEGWTYSWTVNGVEVATTATLDGADFNKGDAVVCAATPWDGEASGAAVRSTIVTVANTAPVLASAELSTYAPTEGDTLTVTLGAAADADGDAVSYSYAWYVNGAVVGTGRTLTGARFDKGNTIYVVVTPDDGTDSGAAVSSPSATAANSVPVASTVRLSPATVYTDDTVTASVAASDADGDALTYSYDWYVDGIPRGSASSATLSGERYFDKDQGVYVVVTPNDGTADGTSVTSSTVTVSNTAPTAPVVEVTPADAMAGDDLTCSVTTAASDVDGDAVSYSFAWYVDGVAYTGASSSATESWVDGADVDGDQLWQCAVSTSDGDSAGGRGSDSVVTSFPSDCSSFRFSTVGSYFYGAPTSAYTMTYSTGNTIEFWLYPDSTGSVGEVVGSRTGDLPSWSIRFSPTSVGLEHGINNGDYETVSGSYTPNAWHHVAFVRSSTFTTNWKVFVDGVDVTVRSRSGSADHSDISFPIGLHIGGQPGYPELTGTGAIASLELSNTARYTTGFTPSDVLTPDSKTILYYDFAEGSGTNTYEGTGTGYDLSISSGTWQSSGPGCP